MALSGSFNTNGYDGRYYTLSWSASQSIAGNYSTISWSISCAGGSGWYAERTLYAKLAGQVLVNKTDRVQRYAGTVASGSFNVSHDSVGAKSISGSMRVAVYYSSVNCTGSGSWSLNTIPRQANLTAAPNFNDTQNPTISYSNPAGNNVSSLQACISLTGSKDDIAYRNISKTGSSYTFSLTDAERNVLRNATTSANSRTVTFFVKTVIGGTTFYSTIARTLTITGANPTLTPTVVDTNATTIALTGNSNTLVKYYSNAKASATYSTYKGATLKSYKLTYGGSNYTANPQTFNGVQGNSFAFEIYDSRGNAARQTVTKTLIDYVKLTCNARLKSFTADGEATLAIHGNYWSGNFGAAANTLTLQYRYKVDGGDYSDWIAISPTISGNTYSVDHVVSGLNYQNLYYCQVRAIDKLATVPVAEFDMQGTPVFDWSAEDFHFHVPVTFVDGNQEYPILGLINSATKLYDLETLVSTGSNYSDATCTARLCGNQLRFQFAATRSAATGAGNITNETVCNVTVYHDGKISEMLNIAFPNGATGGTASFQTLNVAYTGETLSFDIVLTATGVAVTDISTFFQAPVSLNLNAFV